MKWMQMLCLAYSVDAVRDDDLIQRHNPGLPRRETKTVIIL